MLVLLAMILAAVSLTSALSYGKVEMPASYSGYRQLIGGEILVVPTRWTGFQSDDLQGQSSLVYNKLSPQGMSWLEEFYPELYYDGFLHEQGSPPSQFVSATLLTEMLQVDGVSGYSVNPQLVAYYGRSDGIGGSMLVAVLPLPGGRYENLSGRLFTSEEQAQALPVALANAYLRPPRADYEKVRANIPDNRFYGMPVTNQQIEALKNRIAQETVFKQLQLPEEGMQALLEFPSLQQLGDEWDVDHSNTTQLEVSLVGSLSVPLRQLTWITEMGDTLTETSYLHGSYVWLPQSTWQQVYDQVAKGDGYPLTNVTLKVQDMSRLSEIVFKLQRQFPGYSFIGVPDFVARMETYARLDWFYQAPDRLWKPGEGQTLAMPIELGEILGMLMFLIAGMLTATRMLTGAAARRLEIGILKALGARRRDIIAMTLTESLLVSFIGSSIGFFLIRLTGVIMELSNDMPIKAVLSRTVSEFSMVVGMACLVSLLFAILPAWRMSNLTVMEVLRNE